MTLLMLGFVFFMRPYGLAADYEDVLIGRLLCGTNRAEGDLLFTPSIAVIMAKVSQWAGHQT